MAKRALNLRSSLWDRFHDKALPEPNSGCWLWIGAVKEFGYGVIGLGRREQGTAKAHRVAYELYCGPIPAGQNVLHRCDNPSCVNPEHLFLGSLSDNMKDCVSKGRNFCPDNRGSRAAWAKLTESDVADIRKRAVPGRTYAKRYGVSKSAVFAIWSGTTWSSA
jgi:hypothetical protein